MKRLRTTAGGGSGWSALPGDLLEQISGYLSTDADHLHIHQVCAPWRACTPSPSAFRPWILARWTARSPPPAPSSCNYSVWLPRRHLQREVGIGAPPAGVPYCCGASRGWLALTDNASSPTRLVLWDPASGAEVHLPPLPGVIQVFLSADPLASPDWMAVASQRYGNMGAQKPFFCRPGDAAWSVLCDRPTAGVDRVAFHGGRIYYMDWMHVLVVCDLNRGPAPHVQIRNISGHISRLCSCDRYHGIRRAHMVSCAGDLLLVVLRNDSGHPSFAEIYKLESPPERGPPLELGDRVTDLGNHSLFLARGENFALSAKEFPAIRRNHIYGLEFDGNYSRNYDHAWPDWAFVFDLGSGTLKKIPYPGEFRDEGSNWQPLFWLCLRSQFMRKQQNALSRNEDPATLSSAAGVEVFRDGIQSIIC
ncbi:uncharacterized protein LOC120643471 [Panicum virgatum]|uniref:KIB1-4 beta-propeller domain-containing protein n=1 Tax=Panicum virgatum TaxID=38727 RepID=A0A8T0PCI3_PANVG|nr:uncharacterized protein LOC120643471 [Panicum virgatum]KAG2559851.1 hypothetical protein PVAP13_8KG118000 [Panicum virgatum]